MRRSKEKTKDHKTKEEIKISLYFLILEQGTAVAVL